MKAELINLEDYNYSGEGANGASYNHKTDPRFMLKLYNTSKPLDFITSELERARKVYVLGIPSPKPGVLVTDGERYGIRFERILNKRSFSRAVGDDPSDENIRHCAGEFARMCKQLHSTECPAGMFENVKDVYKRDLKYSFFSDEEKKKVAEFIDSVPDARTAIHGDLQFSNAITDGNNNYFIDLGDFACGNPLFDLGMVLMCCKYSDDAFIEEVFHMKKATSTKFWECFVPEYFDGKMTSDQAEKMLRPFAGLKSIIIERDCRQPFPHYRALLDEIVKG